jgi:AcrR family transcriptional regulator
MANLESRTRKETRTGKSATAPAQAGRAAVTTSATASSESDTPVLTKRGAQTRAKLVVAARLIFEEDGFLDARITDIADRADVAHGTFYTYFESKLEVFQAVVEEMMLEITPRDEGPDDHDDPVRLIAEANKQYFRVFQRNKALFAALDQVGSFDPQGQTMRRRLRRGYESVAYTRIKRWQLQGHIDALLDPKLASIAVTALVGRFTQVCLAFESDIPERQALKQLNRMYALALGIRPE